MTTRTSTSIDVSALDEAGRSFLSHVIVGGFLAETLEELMPALGCFGSGLARLTPPRMVGLPTSGIREVVEDIAARRTSPLSHLTRIDPGPQDGFVCDQLEVYREARAGAPWRPAPEACRTDEDHLAAGERTGRSVDAPGRYPVAKPLRRTSAVNAAGARP